MTTEQKPEILLVAEDDSAAEFQNLSAEFFKLMTDRLFMVRSEAIEKGGHVPMAIFVSAGVDDYAAIFEEESEGMVAMFGAYIPYKNPEIHISRLSDALQEQLSKVRDASQ